MWEMDGEALTSGAQPSDVPEPDAIAQLRAAVDALSKLDPSDLPTAVLADICMDLQRQRHRLGGLAAHLLKQWQGSGVWAFDGSRSSSSRLARETRAGVRSCRRELRRAAATPHLPAVTAAVIDGGLCIDHFDLFAAIATPTRRAAMERDQHRLVEKCRELNFAGARTLLAYWATAVDATICPDSVSAAEDPSRLYLSETFYGNWIMDGAFTPVAGNIVATELSRLEQLIAQDDLRTGRIRTPAQRRAAALVEMAQRSAHLAPGSVTPRPLFTVLLGEQTFAQLCELANGTVLTPNQLVPALSSADLETVLFDGPHTVVSVSHRRRFTGAVRRAIEVRDRHCTHPSDCDVPAARCDVDHITAFSQHGPTSQFNGRLQCPTHNRNAVRHATSQRLPIAPARPLTELDHIRGRLRYNYHRNCADNDADTASDPTSD